MSSNPAKKLILVIGATGAQGLPLIDKLLEKGADGSPSPYIVRAFTRDSSSRRARLLADKGVELFQGNIEDEASVGKALQGVYGAFVNIDGFKIGEIKEIFCSMRVFELAIQAKTVRHFVYSGLESYMKVHNRPVYHCDGKGRVVDWMKAQPSVVGKTTMAWSVLHTTPYMDMLYGHMFGPMYKREDGTFVFAAPIGQGHVPMVALSDVAWFGRYIFDNIESTSGQELKIASEVVGWDHLVETFCRVTGEKVVAKYVSPDEWFSFFDNADRPLASDQIENVSWRLNFTGWWSTWRDDIIKRDMEWVSSLVERISSVRC